MKNVILISLLSLFSASAFASTASVKISIKSNIKAVTVTAKSMPFVIQEDDQGMMIKEVVVKTANLSVTPNMAAGKMKKKQFLNVENYPEITVNTIVCESATAKCSLNLKIKGIENSLAGTYSTTATGARIRFDMLLSEFDISQKISLFSINDKALVEVDIVK